MNRLYLVRHGENLANLTKQFSHRKVDYPLTLKGRLQAEQTAEYFKDKNIRAIYSSPLKRAVQTAEIIAARLSLQHAVIENFREINVGVLEELPVSSKVWATHNQILNDWFASKPWMRFPGGEDYFTLWQRTQTGIEQILAGKEGHNIIIVAHGGIFTLTLKDLCADISVNWLRRTENHNCSVSEILIEKHNGCLEGTLIFWASHAHLHGEAADLVPATPQADTYQTGNYIPG